MSLNDQLEHFIRDFIKAKKPIGMCCIAPIMIARMLGTTFDKPEPGAKITLGKKGNEKDWPYQGSIDIAKKWGNNLVEADVNEVIYDDKYLLFSTPAYMKGTAKYHEVYDGINSLVDEVTKWLKK